MAKFYAGIGARKTPPEVLNWMIGIGSFMAQHGWTLRSGAADGADTAFEKGCDMEKGSKEIFLPWSGYNNRTDLAHTPIPDAAYDIASLFHPAWGQLKQGVRKLMARNCQQLGGANLDSRTDLVICWTPDGKSSGGTGQALRIADAAGIPILNLHGMAVQDVSVAIGKYVEKE